MKVHRFVTNDFTVRISAVDTTEVVQEMQSIQHCLPLAAIGVGRAMTGALLMASQLKPGQEVGVLLKGNGPLGSLYGQASYEGHVRGYCPYPDYQAPKSEDFLSVGKALGNGTLTVTRQQPFQKQPHHGTVELVTGEVGDDIAHYLHQSHQIRSLVSLGVYIDTYGKVKAAGGVVIEVMPGVEEAIVEKIEDNANRFQKNISQLILDGAKPIDLVKPYLEGLPFTQIPHDFPVSYHCPCTNDRVKRALGTLGMNDLNEMIAEDKVSNIQCQMCGRNYQVTVQELEELRAELLKNSMH